MNQFIPRLCHIKKRADFSGYGYTLRLHEQGGRKHVSGVDIDSPAEEAGLLVGDILIEVNGANVEDEPDASVLQRIIDSGEEVYLLVVNAETDHFYKELGQKVTGAMPGIKHMDCRTHICKTNSYGHYGQQEMNPNHAGYDQKPSNDPPKLNPYYVGYDPTSYEQSFGGSASSYPIIQQPRTPTLIQPIVVERDIPSDLTLPALLVCCFCCWCTGALAIYNAQKATEHFHQGNFQQGKRYRDYAITAMVITVIIGIVIGASSIYRVMFNA